MALFMTARAAFWWRPAGHGSAAEAPSAAAGSLHLDTDLDLDPDLHLDPDLDPDLDLAVIHTTLASLPWQHCVLSHNVC